MGWLAASTRNVKRRPMPQFDLIAFDADDTLWQNEHFFRLTEATFADLLKDYAEADHLLERLLAAQKRNLGHYGFGIKGFILSMIETAVDVTEGKAPSSVVNDILAAGREMLRHPVELLPGAEETVRTLAETHEVILITKGDLFDQERKIAQSGIDDAFKAIEIVSTKNVETYKRFFETHGSGPRSAMMVGNSMRSDVVPAIEAGGWGVFVPHELTWDVEHAEAPEGHPRFAEIKTLEELPALIAGWR